MADENERVVEQESVELEHLEDEGEALLPEEDEIVEEEPEEESTEDTSEQVALASRMDAMESKLAEKDAEIAYLRGLAARQQKPEPAETDDTYGFDLDELASRLTNKDAKIGVKALLEVADRIAAKKIEAERANTHRVVSESSAERAAKDRDYEQVNRDFAEDMQNPLFMKTLQEVFTSYKSHTGPRYVPDSLYMAAATTKTMIDRAKKNMAGSKNGVTPVRARNNATNTTIGGAEDYSKVTSIASLPDDKFSPKQKSAMRAVAKRMGVSEKDWIANLETEE